MLPTSTESTRFAQYSRRDVFKFAATAGVAALAGNAVAAEQTAPAAKPITPRPGGSFRIDVGDIRLHLIADGTISAPLGPTFAVNGDPQEIEAQLKKHFMPTETPAPVAINGLLIEAPDAKILIDTGTAMEQPSSAGLLPMHLAALGIKASDLNAVVVTHNHFDHISGLIAPHTAHHFAGVDVLMTKIEIDFWNSNPSLDTSAAPEEVRQSVRDQATAALAKLDGRIKPVSPTEKLAAGVQLIDLAGHTPGHVGVQIDSGGERMYYLTDFLHVAAMQFAHPEWYAVFDVDSRQAVATRKRWLDKIATDRIKIAGTHLPFPATGHVRREGDGYAFEPVVWTF